VPGNKREISTTFRPDGCGNLKNCNIAVAATIDRGQVVGQSGDGATGAFRAFIWQGGVITDLNALIPAGSDLFLVAPFEINSRGQIVGIAVQNSTGQSHGFLATPTKGGSIGSGPTRGESPKIALPENLRKLLWQRLGLGRFGASVMRPK
jgi:probable HAF family extracellular repeat protein